MVKRCFICGAKEDAGLCSNVNCPRYVAITADTAAENTTAQNCNTSEGK